MTAIIGTLIRAERERRGLTQHAASMHLCVRPRTVSTWETGRSCPSTRYHRTIAGWLGVSLREVSDACLSEEARGRL